MRNETARREIESLDYYLQNHTDDYSEESHAAMMMAIDALNNADVLEQIRDEIEALPRELPTDARNMVRRTRVLDIIDRHIKGADK